MATPVTGNNRAESPFFPEYYSNTKLPTIAANSSPTDLQTTTSTSQNEIDPSLQQLDAQRRAVLEFPALDSKGRPTFTAIIAEIAKLPGHNIVKERIRDIVQNKRVPEYSQYLANVRLDLTAIELFLIGEKNIPSSLLNLYRSSALTKDLINLQIIPECKLRSHYDYFVSQIDRPYLLVGHYAVHLLGLLADGKHIAKKMTDIWGERATTQFYQFENDPEQLRAALKQDLNTYAETLTDEQLKELQTELKKIWPMIGELFSMDLREKK